MTGWGACGIARRACTHANPARKVSPMIIRPATKTDADAVWSMLEPVLRAGETYALPRDLSRAEALGYWNSPGHDVFVAEDAGVVVGTYYLRANQKGGGAHVANCGYITSAPATGRGVARAMCLHSLDVAAAKGFCRHAVQSGRKHERARGCAVAAAGLRHRRNAS